MERVLQERYELRRRIGEAAAVIRWAAFDRVTNTEAELCEFYAPRIMQRTENGISALPGCEVPYKALASDYEELCRYVMSLPEQSPAIRPIDLFHADGTVWAVYPITDCQPLEDYLARCGTMSWTAMKKAMGPIVGLVGQMHAQGVLHRGISEKTIFVDPKGKFFLSGFAVAPARTVGSEIDATLFFGYSAPEQYSSSSWQGTWTDVYSLAAVCYRIVTGTTPVEWRQRSEKHPLLSPDVLAAGMPDYGAKAICKGLQIDLSDRFRTAGEFWSAVLEEPGGETIRYVVPEIAKRSDPMPAAEPPRRLPWILVGVLLLLVLCLTTALLSRHIAEKYLAPPAEPSSTVSESSSASREEKSEAPQLVVPDFVGTNVEEVLLNSLYQQLFEFEIERAYSEEKPAGIIIGQTPAAETAYAEPVTVTLTVSKGSERTTMPDIIGLPYEQAVQILSESEITYAVEYTEAGDAIGCVTSADAPAGSILYRTRDVVTLWIRADAK